MTAPIHNAILFSTYFKIPAEQLSSAGLIDPFLNVDMPLFIDPVLLDKSSNKFITPNAYRHFCDHFEKLVRLITISENRDDAAWKAARRQLDLSEPPENGLGYGGTGRSGRSRPEHIREAILTTSSQIIALGAKDPEMISLMGFFEEHVGPDTISDLTTRVIMSDLVELTEDFCKTAGVEISYFTTFAPHELPKFTDEKGRTRPIILVPQDIVRDLPIANDWSDIERAAMENATIRERVNRLLAGLIKPTIVDRKNALRNAVLSSSSDFDFFLAAVKANVFAYDPNLDALGYYRLKDILAKGFPDLKRAFQYDLTIGPLQILEVVRDTISFFKKHIELGNLWEELWLQNKPKKERAAQLIYYAIADAFCKANDIDISPEANMGGGPIDFKFSKGYSARVLVEIKKSGGTVVHGYEKQLEFYRAASQTDFAIFVVIDYGDLGNKLAVIREMHKHRTESGQRASEIVVIDARKKLSASKRN